MYISDATVISREISDFLASAKDSVSLSDVNVTNRCARLVDDAKYPRDYPSFTFIEIRRLIKRPRASDEYETDLLLIAVFFIFINIIAVKHHEITSEKAK